MFPLRHKCTIAFSTTPCKWEVLEGFFDKYQLDHCPLTKCILELKNTDDVYQVPSSIFIRGFSAHARRV